MKKLFYVGILGFLAFEVANVYFIMPMPGSQEMNSIQTAYFLYAGRWVFRFVFAAMILLGCKSAFKSAVLMPSIALLVLLGCGYIINGTMAADTMFYQPKTLAFKNSTDSKVERDRLVLGVAYQDFAKAYPIQYLGYHHQVRDTLGGKPIMVTYCTVCRTGRVFEPVVNGKTEQFRLVGMDHFNAMFEDATTGSWWRQATGEAITGPLKGKQLPEYPSVQMTLEKWLELYPASLVMQPDALFQVEYDSMQTYERGRLTGTLTRRDTASWKDKSWVIGVEMGNESKAYDWSVLSKESVIYDEIANHPIAVILAKDRHSFVVLERTNRDQTFRISNDTLNSVEGRYNFIGQSQNPAIPDLTRVKAHQEYWHSWRTFHPATKTY